MFAACSPTRRSSVCAESTLRSDDSSVDDYCRNMRVEGEGVVVVVFSWVCAVSGSWFPLRVSFEALQRVMMVSCAPVMEVRVHRTQEIETQHTPL